MNKLSNFTKTQLELSGLVLLVPFPKFSGDLYMRCGALMELWSAWEWLYVAVQLHARGVE